jgi:hypothetical protein
MTSAARYRSLRITPPEHPPPERRSQPLPTLRDLIRRPDEDEALTLEEIRARLRAQEEEEKDAGLQRRGMVLGQLLGDQGLGLDLAGSLSGGDFGSVATALSGGAAPPPPDLSDLQGLVGGQGLPPGGGLGETVRTWGQPDLPSMGNFDRWGQTFENAAVPIGRAGDYMTAVRQQGGPTVYMRPDVAANFVAMERAAGRRGVDLVAGEGYRDWDAQAAADARNPPGYAASPGSSMHGMGTAIDLSDYDHDWLARNAERFGFYQPMDYEPWHWQPITAESGGYSEGEQIPTLYSRPAQRLYERQGELPGQEEITQGDFARRLLREVDAPRTPENTAALLAWQQAEEEPTPGFNPLNTTMGGGAPTQGFGSFREGIQATADTLELPYYDQIRAALERGDDPMAVVRAIQESPWAAGGYGGSLPSVLSGLNLAGEAGQVLGTRRLRTPEPMELPTPTPIRRRGRRGFGQRA